MIFNEELRHFSIDCAKNCDEAFRTTLMEVNSVGGSWTEGEKKRRESTPFSATLESTMTTTPATEMSTASWQTRPLPPLPVDVGSEQCLAPSLRDVESQLMLGDGDTDSQVDGAPRIAQSAMVCKQADRRAVSAPVYNHNPVRKLSALPSIRENAAVMADGDRTRVVSAPPHSRPKNEGGMTRNREYLSKVENTIRVVHSPGSGSPVKMPSPLHVRKKLATEDFGSKLHRQLAYNAESYDDEAVEPPAKDANTTLKKKKLLFWFRRSSKAEPGSAGVCEQKGARGSVALKDSFSDADSAKDTAKKVFTFSFWKGNKARDSGVAGQGTLDTRSPRAPKTLGRRLMTGQEDAVRGATDNQVAKGMQQQKHASGMRDSGSGSIRNIAVKQNWLTRLFRVKPATGYICLTLPQKRARQEIATLLREWRRYGMKDIQVDKKRDIVFARLGAKNRESGRWDCWTERGVLTRSTDLNLNEVGFAAEVMKVIEGGKRQPLSIVRFTQERGAASSLYRVVDTMRLVFDSRHLVMTDMNKQNMIITTLNMKSSGTDDGVDVSRGGAGNGRRTCEDW